MKIAICSSTMILTGLGITSYAHDFIAAFPEHRFTVFTGDAYQAPADATYDVVNFNARDLSVANARELAAKINAGNFDIVVNSCVGLVSLIVPYLTAPKIIGISHFVNGHLAWSAGKNHPYLSRIVALSSYGRDYFRRNFGEEAYAKSVCIFNRLPAEAPLSSPRKPGPLRIVFPGGSNRLKGCDLVYKILLGLLATDLDFEFHWIGDTRIPGRRYLRVKALDIADIIPDDPRVKHVGRVNRDEATKIMEDADIFLLPSRAEGFPITLCEALRGGCIPIISDSRHGSLDFVKDGVNGFVLPQHKPSPYVELIREIITRPANYDTIRKNAYESAKKELSPEKWKESMTEVLEAAPNRTPARRFSAAKYRTDLMALRRQIFIREFVTKKNLLLNALQFPFTKPF